MTNEQLKKIESWFNSYVIPFTEKDAEHRTAYAVKIEHSLKVSQEMETLAWHRGLDASTVAVSRAIGLLHDIGRFEQFARYQTFRDVETEDHAALSCQVIDEYHLLDDLNVELKDGILYAIAHHNKKDMPVELSLQNQDFLKMIRDADKLDIWRVVCEYYQQPDGHEAIGLDLPDAPAITPEVVQTIRNRELVFMGDLRTLNDFKLLQMAWVFDLNFPWSHQAVAERGYMEQIAATLPDEPVVAELLQTTQTYLSEKMKRGHDEKN